MGLFGPKTHIKLSISDADLYEEDEKKTTREVDKNFLDEKWWETATPEDVEAEIKKGADVNAVLYDEDGLTTDENPLSLAVKNARIKAFTSNPFVMENSMLKNESPEFIMEYINRKYNYEKTPEAIEKFKTKHNDIFEKVTKEQIISEENIRILIKHGADVNAICDISLYEVCHDYFLNIINILIESGLDVNKKICPIIYFDNKDHSKELVRIAAEHGAEKVVQRLLEAGAKDTRSFMEKIKTHLG